MAVKITTVSDFNQKPALMFYAYIMSFLVMIQLICDAVALITVDFSKHIHISASGIIFPIAFVMIGITANIYGSERAKIVALAMTIAQFIFCMAVFTFALIKKGQIYPDNSVTTSFYDYFHRYWTVTASGILDTFLPLWICSVLTSKCKKWFIGKTSQTGGFFYNFPFFGYFFTILIPLCISQLSLVLITYSINFGLGVGVSFSELINIITSTYIYKLAIGLTISLLLTRPLVRLCRIIDKIDTYDYGVSYSVLPKKANTGINNFSEQLS